MFILDSLSVSPKAASEKSTKNRYACSRVDKTTYSIGILQKGAYEKCPSNSDGEKHAHAFAK